MSDVAIARAVSAGDESAAEAFFAEYFPRVYRFARARLGGDEAAAEDVTQATLIRAVRKLHTYRGEAALFTWLCTLCRREIAAWNERTGKRAERTIADDLPDLQAALDAAARLASDPETEAGRRELSRLVHLTLEQLPARYGDALDWKYVQGLPVEEIGRRLGIGYKAAESLLSRARQAFRDSFSLAIGSAPIPSAGPPPKG
jgi:RNA polymerase sigma-70 factor (ECF subfamily)